MPAPTPEPVLTRPLPPARLTEVQGRRPGPLVGALAGLVMDAVCALPPGARDALARFVGWLAYALGVRRAVVMENLARALPELGAAEHRRIARGAYANMARVVVESLDLRDHLGDWEEAADAVRGPGWPALRAQLQEGRGALLVTGHFGNWERAGKMLLRRGVRVNALVRPLKGALNMRIVDGRLASGAGLIFPRGAIAHVSESVRRGECVLALLDQAMPLGQGVFVPFFGRPASTTPAVAVAARRARAPVYVVMGVRDASGRRLHLEVEGPFPPPEGLSPHDALVAHTAQLVAALEGFVRRHPEQWLWLHRRWKVQPPPEGPAAADAASAAAAAP